MSTRVPGRKVPLARRQLLYEPLKLGLALAGVALAVALGNCCSGCVSASTGSRGGASLEQGV